MLVTGVNVHRVSASGIRTLVYKSVCVRLQLNPDMEPGSEEAEIPLVRTNQELSATSAHDFLWAKEHVTAMLPTNPLGGMVFLYHSPGKEGEHAQLALLSHFQEYCASVSILLCNCLYSTANNNARCKKDAYIIYTNNYSNYTRL